MIIKITSGNTLNIVYTIKDEANAVVDLTGGSIAWSINNPDGTSIVSKTSPSGGVVLTTPGSGIMTVTLDPADTTGLKGIYDVLGRFTDSGANVYTFDSGHIRVN